MRDVICTKPAGRFLHLVVDVYLLKRRIAVRFKFWLSNEANDKLSLFCTSSVSLYCSSNLPISHSCSPNLTIVVSTTLKILHSVTIFISKSPTLFLPISQSSLSQSRYLLNHQTTRSKSWTSMRRCNIFWVLFGSCQAQSHSFDDTSLNLHRPIKCIYIYILYRFLCILFIYYLYIEHVYGL